MTRNDSHLFVLSAPSGTGKTTVAQEALRQIPHLVRSISFTTREPRIENGEKDGVDYFFISKEEFEKRIQKNDFLEWAKIYGGYYGTSKSYIQNILDSGKHALLVIDVQGAVSLKKLEIPNVIYLFLKPPNLVELEKRLRKRGTEQEIIIQKRLDQAKHEMSFQNIYDHVLINDKLEECIRQFITIINSYPIKEKA